MSSDLIKFAFPGFAELRDRLGLRTVRQDGSEIQFGAHLEGAGFNLDFLHDRVDHSVSIGLPGSKKRHYIGIVLEWLGVWRCSHLIRDEIEMARVFEANLDRVLNALKNEAFLEAEPRIISDVFARAMAASERERIVKAPPSKS